MPVPQSFPERTSSLKVPKWQATPITPDTPSAVRRSAFNSHPPDTSPKIIDNSIDVDVPLAPPAAADPAAIRCARRSPSGLTRLHHQRTAGADGQGGLLAIRSRRRPSSRAGGSSFDSASDVSRPFSGSIYSTDDDRAGGGSNTVATSTHWSPGSTPPEPSRRMQSQFEKAYARGVAQEPEPGDGRRRPAAGPFRERGQQRRQPFRGDEERDKGAG
ncbi:hypothetical protein OPQ81_003775 [Rhizoctonia solani]|nr:hypothetical protein OPQ81_003775 [Rhizoctonia solani]